MKKTLVALAVLAAGSAQAGIEIYNENNVTVDLKGDIEVVYKQALTDGAELTQEIQDADFGFDVRYAINDDLQFGGYWEFDGANDSVTKGTSKNVAAGNTYVALYSQAAGSIKFGRLDSILDDAGVGSDYQFGIKSFFQNGSPFGADESVRYDLDKGAFYGGVAYKQDKNNNAGLGQDGYMVDAKLGYRVADFDFTGYYGKAKFKGPQATVKTDGCPDNGAVGVCSPEVKAVGAFDADETLWALEARFSGVENLNLELGYYNVDPKASDEKVSSVAVAADYTVEAWKFATGYSNTHQDGADNLNSWFVNAGYGVAPSTTVYAEVGGNDADNSQVGYAVGVKAEF